MSDYERLQEIVTAISSESNSYSVQLADYCQHLEQQCTFFMQQTEGTRDGSAKQVTLGFLKAVKCLALASEALRKAAETGFRWSGVSDTQPVLTLKKRR